MFSATDYDKLQQIMAESPEKCELLTRLLETQKMTISSISHEIRNPLTLVYSTLQLIQSQHPEVLSFKHWDSLLQDVEYMMSLLEELSSYNNSERLILSTIDTEHYLKAISLSFAASIVDTNIEFISQIAPDLPQMQADSLKLREVILNLLANAKDAVADVSEPKISFSCDLKDHSLEITISDNGCGIPKDKVTQIFEPFITYKANGTGLGLAIASRIAHAHGGNLAAASIPGSVTRFSLTLPI
ncbi:MAG: sensor histidine kinase [Dorea sp.]